MLTQVQTVYDAKETPQSSMHRVNRELPCDAKETRVPPTPQASMHAEVSSQHDAKVLGGATSRGGKSAESSKSSNSVCESMDRQKLQNFMKKALSKQSSEECLENSEENTVYEISSRPKEEEPRRLSFMSYDSTPYTELLLKLRSRRESEDSEGSGHTASEYVKSLLSEPSNIFGSLRGSLQSESLGEHDTMLLDMVRARSQAIQDEAEDQPLDLPRDDVSEVSSEACVHGLRITERSVSRSRVSRISTRRDMDIPSILAFTISTPAPMQLEIPAFKKPNMPKPEEVPKWSIRRSVCPVCSQKWRDRSDIYRIRHSGLKRNMFLDLPSVIAPARLRTSIIMGTSRPAIVAIDNEPGGLRNNSASWQLTRARRFRIPKIQMPSPEAAAPPSITAPLARKDLDTRVIKFLTT